MSTSQWVAVAAWVILPLAASAQEKTETSPLDPGAPTPALRYESAFSNFRSAQDDSQSPDQLWRSANEEMGRLGGHVGHMKEAAPELSTAPGAGTAAPSRGAPVHGQHH